MKWKVHGDSGHSIYGVPVRVNSGPLTFPAVYVITTRLKKEKEIMAYKIRVATRKEQLRKPDEFIGTMDRLGDAIRRNARIAWMIIGMALVIGAGIGAYMLYQEHQNSRAASLEYQGLQYYRQQPPTDDKTAASSPAENYKKAVEQFQKIAQEYPRTPSGMLSQLYLGNAYMELKEFDSAIPAYRAFLEMNPKNDILAGSAYQRLGYAYLAKNDIDNARQVFESVERLAGALNRDQVGFELGRIDEAQGKNDAAIKRYQDVVSRYPDSLFLSEAQRRLSALGVAEAKPEGSNPVGPVSPSNQPIAVVPVPQQKPAPGNAPTATEKK
jgi:TolA-binding protein